MATWRKLTGLDGEPVYVNLDTAQRLDTPVDGEGARITFSNDETLYVQEMPDTILEGSERRDA